MKVLEKRKSDEISSTTDEPTLIQTEKRPRSDVSETLLSPPTPQLAAYVVTVPVKVDDDSEGESSDDSHETFPEAYYKDPQRFFRLAHKVASHDKQANTSRRGKVLPKSIEQPIPHSVLQTHVSPQSTHASQSTTSQTTYDTRSIQPLIDKFETEAFGINSQTSRTQVRARLRLSIGFNRLRSLSTRNNRTLSRAVNQSIQSPNDHQKFGFYWEGIWEEYVVDKQNSAVYKWKIVDYQRVKEFYKQLKHKDPIKAKAFRKHVESAKKYQVPYREIRDTIKNHKQTKALVTQFRQSNMQREVYLSIADADVVSLRSGNEGTFSHYDIMLREHFTKYSKPVEIGSVGYMIPKIDITTGESNPMLALGVKLDLWVRHATAQIVKNGVYYPEPCSIIRVLPGTTTVVENFSTQDKNYKSPCEMVRISETVIKQRQLSADNSMSFNANGAIVTTRPPRFSLDSTAREDSEGKIVRWTLAELKKLRGVSQSHYCGLQWSKRIVAGLVIPKKTTLVFKDNSLLTLDKTEIMYFLSSAISRLYSHYDALDIAQRICEKHKHLSNFQKEFITVLKEYDPKVEKLKPVDRAHASVRKSHIKLWEVLDNVTDIAGLKEFINPLLQSEVDGDDQNPAEAIESAAIAASLESINLLMTHLSLDFISLCEALMKDYFLELRAVSDKSNESFQTTLINERTLHNNLRKETGGFLEEVKHFLDNNHSEEKWKDSNGAMPMHWAAITGNNEIVKYLKSIRFKRYQALKDIEAKAKFDVTPLHCAVLYCAEFGTNDLPLLRSLLTKKNLLTQTNTKQTPLGLAITKLLDPLPVIEMFLSINAHPLKHQTCMSTVVQKITKSMFPAIIAYAIFEIDDKQARLEFIHFLLEQGIDPNIDGKFTKDEEGNIVYHPLAISGKIDSSNHSNELDSDSASEQSKILSISPLILAIQEGDLALVALLLAYKAKYNEIYDPWGLPPLLIAIRQLQNSQCMIGLLLYYEKFDYHRRNPYPPGSDDFKRYINDFSNVSIINECELDTGTNALHAVISFECDDDQSDISLPTESMAFLARHNDTKKVELLLKKSIAETQNVDYLHILLRFEQIDLHHENREGQSVMDIAIDQEDAALILTLCDAGFDLDRLSTDTMADIRTITGNSIYNDEERDIRFERFNKQWKKNILQQLPARQRKLYTLFPETFDEVSVDGVLPEELDERSDLSTSVSSLSEEVSDPERLVCKFNAFSDDEETDTVDEYEDEDEDEDEYEDDEETENEEEVEVNESTDGIGSLSDYDEEIDPDDEDDEKTSDDHEDVEAESEKLTKSDDENGLDLEEDKRLDEGDRADEKNKIENNMLIDVDNIENMNNKSQNDDVENFSTMSTGSRWSPR